MAHSWIHLPRSEGRTSRQAHADLPAGTYEREIGREGFYGPVTQMHHRHPPTGWVQFEGPLRPRAFDGTRIEPTGNGPWGAAPLLSNAAVKMRLWKGSGAMDHLDGDQPPCPAGRLRKRGRRPHRIEQRQRDRRAQAFQRRPP